MTRGLVLVVLAGLAGLAGCPDDPHKATTWTKKLGGREHERALKEIEQIGDPVAIPALGDVWRDHARQPAELEVIIGLASALTPQEAAEKFRTDFEKTGRPASWDVALPFLIEAITKVDDANPRSVEGASKAAEAIGVAKLPDGLDALIEIANKPIAKNLITAQIAAIRAMGKFDNEKTRAAAALVKLIDREAPQHPRTVNVKREEEKQQLKAIEEKYKFFLAVSSASINSLGELHIKTASKTLLRSLYRTPELFDQIRRALVATGPNARDELRKTVQGKNPEIEQLFKDKKLHRYCGDKNDAPPEQCLPVSAKEFYAAVVLGDFYDADTVPDLLAVLEQPSTPAYYIDDEPGPSQYQAVFDALRKIGAPSAAAAVRAKWMSGPAAPRGAPRGRAGGPPPAPPMPGSELQTKVLAIGAYPFVARDDTGSEELARIAGDNDANDDLRREAATAFARLSRNRADMRVLEALANKYFEASAKKRAEADGKPKADTAKADAQLKLDQAKLAAAKQKVQDTARDRSKTAADINAASADAKKADEEFKAARRRHRDAVAPYKHLDSLSKGYRSIARMFQAHIARIEIGIRCKTDLKCFASTLSATDEDVVKAVRPYITTTGTYGKVASLDAWTKDEKLWLREGSVERAMLELGKQGHKASGYTELLLDNAKTDNRQIRQSILLALPKIAKVPCENCERKLDAAIKFGEGKTTVAGLQLETQMLRNYFTYAGGREPTVEQPPPPSK